MNIKNNIKKLIEENNIKEAEKLIKKYEEKFINDIEFLSMKSIVLIINKEFEIAEEILVNIINIDKYNCDAYFNLGYIYEIKGKIEKSISFYKKAKENSKDKKFIENVDIIIETIYKLIEKKRNHKTSIIILTYNKLNYTKLCIESIRKYTEKNSYEIIVVDNKSTDETQEWLKEQEDLKIILNEENLGFPGGCNVGILASEKDNDIMLLNNDTIVTPRWLENLQKCLYSDENIGAVGPVTNNCANYQSIEVDYDTVKDLHSFAENYNISDANKWEQKVKLIGYCMLIKREVINKVGLLDEAFSPGNFEDDDLCYRIQKEKYKLILCNDTFIHHFGSVSFKEKPKEYIDLLEKNSLKFIKKWGFDSEESSFVDNIILSKIDYSKKNINLLHVGCGTGATLYKAKSKSGNVNIYGVGSNENEIEILNGFIDARIKKLASKANYEKNFFDYIVISDYLKDTNKFNEELINLLEILKPNGEIFINIKNSNYYKEIIKLILGKKNKNTLRLYNIDEIKDILNYKDFDNILIESVVEDINIENEKIINYLTQISNEEMKSQYLTEKYIISFKKKDNEIFEKEIEYILRRIENNIDYDKNLNSIYEYIKDIDIETICKIIFRSIVKKDEISNLLSLEFYKRERYIETIKLLNFAYDYNKYNKEVVFNISVLMDKINERDTAIKYLNEYLDNIYDEDLFELREDIIGDNNE